MGAIPAAMNARCIIAHAHARTCNMFKQYVEVFVDGRRAWDFLFVVVSDMLRIQIINKLNTLCIGDVI